ncbi:copper resistance protein [Escherichia coli]|uniref:Membrane protein, suppressor for copper-sensitivity A n=1 Tax=Escherichia coli TA447 TaxID=656447 RepID=A0A1X3IT46_ECOLX|nr:copper resistance protein [Escherichia coli]OSK88013.1 membrane protein, suppressor for copper-sensitivity A [Escherichia coli TA447]
MVKRERTGWLLLCIAFVVVIVCTVQHMACLHSLQMSSAAITQIPDAQVNTDDASSESLCKSRSPSLLSASPFIFEGAILHLGLMVILLAPKQISRLRLFPLRVILPPDLRVYLRFCVFRE